jgi:ankyrin repeat protein
MSDQQSDTQKFLHQDGYTALIWAVQQGNADMVTLLLDKGVQRDIADNVSYIYYVEHAVDDEDDEDDDGDHDDGDDQGGMMVMMMIKEG